MPNVTTDSHTHSQADTLTATHANDLFQSGYNIAHTPRHMGQQHSTAEIIMAKAKKIDAKEYIDMQFDSLTI